MKIDQRNIRSTKQQEFKRFCPHQIVSVVLKMWYTFFDAGSPAGSSKRKERGTILVSEENNVRILNRNAMLKFSINKQQKFYSLPKRY
jgi:hypothetical protein